MNIKLFLDALSLDEIAQLREHLAKKIIDNRMLMGAEMFANIHMDELTVPAIKALRRCEDRLTVGEMTMRNLMKLRHVGKKTAIQITELLNELGIKPID